MKKLFAIASAIILLSLAGRYLCAETLTFQSADSGTTLVELFTSEGCSSCPPAEKWLSKFKNNPDLWNHVVPIAFHVDYWNNLGWLDRFSRPEFTERQRHYGAAWGSESVYTPNFVVNGREWKGWFNGAALPARSDKVGKLSLTVTDLKNVSAVFVSNSAPPASLGLEVALLGSDLESDVKRGENGGRKLRHDFVVLSLAKAKMTKQADGWAATLLLPSATDKDTPKAIAAWVSSGESSPPLQATGGWLKP